MPQATPKNLNWYECEDGTIRGDYLDAHFKIFDVAGDTPGSTRARVECWSCGQLCAFEVHATVEKAQRAAETAF